MAMKSEPDIANDSLKRRYQRSGPLRREDTTGILNDDLIHVRALDNLLCLLDIQFVSMDRAYAIYQPSDCGCAMLFRVV